MPIGAERWSRVQECPEEIEAIGKVNEGDANDLPESPGQIVGCCGRTIRIDLSHLRGFLLARP
jgi:hypothetical protein